MGDADRVDVGVGLAESFHGPVPGQSGPALAGSQIAAAALTRSKVCGPAGWRRKGLLFQPIGSEFRIKSIVPTETTISLIAPKLLKNMARSEDESTVQFRLARAAGSRDLLLGVVVDKATECFRKEWNQEALEAYRRRDERRMNPPLWRRIARRLTGI